MRRPQNHVDDQSNDPRHWNLSRYRACGSAFPRDSRSAASIGRSPHDFRRDRGVRPTGMRLSDEVLPLL